MTTQILLAPPGYGKTQACIEILQQTLSNPAAQVRVVTGSRLQAAAFRRRLAAAGGAAGAEVGTFRDLCREILERSGALLPACSPTLQFRLVQKALEDCDLHYFAPLRTLPGFARTAQTLIGELERALVRPETLAQALQQTGRSGQDELAAIYRAYQDLLASTGWSDAPSQPAQALAALAADPAGLADLDLLVVDGMDWFDPAQRRIFQQLSGRVRRILITLPGEPGWRRSVHRGFQQSFLELDSDLLLETLDFPANAHLPPAVAALEAQLHQPAPAPRPGPQPGIAMLEARTPGDEAREALRWIKRRLCETGSSPTEFALLVRDPDLYTAPLRAAAEEFGLPLRFTQSRMLAEIPMIAAVLNVLALPGGGFAYRPLFDALRSPFFDFSGLGLPPLQVENLDLVSRHGQVIEGLEQWQEVFEALGSLPSAAALPVEDDEGPGTPPSLPRGQAAALLHAAFESFIRRVCPAPGPAPLLGWVAWLEDLLAALGFYPARSQEVTEETRSVLTALRECLQDLLAGETAAAFLGERELDYPAFLTQLQTALENAPWAAPDDPRRPAITVMRALEARGLRFGFVAVLGLSEGLFPRVEQPDPLLDEALRAQLGMQPRLGQDQLGLFYQAITRADQALLLTRPYLTDSGDPWEPSPFWSAVRAIFPDLVQRIRPEDLRPLADAASPAELLFWQARQKAAGSALAAAGSADLGPRHARILAGQAWLKTLLAHGAGPTRAAAPAELVAFAQSRFGPEHTWSTSRLETYLSCPYRFFVENVLKVEAHTPPVWDFDPAQLGTMLHAILEEAYRAAQNPGDAQQVLAALDSAAAEVFRRAPQEFGFRPSPLWDRQQQELLKKLTATVVDLAAEEGDWTPRHFELQFGLQGQPPLELRVAGRTIRLHGVIDRVDVNPQGQLRVVDYKTGSSHLGKPDLVEGRRLQLSVYALAVRDALGLGEPVEGFYWRIGPQGRSGLRLSSFAHAQYTGPRGAIELASEHIAAAVTHLAQAEFSAEPLGGKCSAYCIAAAWCWRFKPE